MDMREATMIKNRRQIKSEPARIGGAGDYRVKPNEVVNGPVWRVMWDDPHMYIYTASDQIAVSASACRLLSFIQAQISDQDDLAVTLAVITNDMSHN